MAHKTGFKTFKMIFLVCALMSVIICSYRGSAMPDKACDTRDGASFVAEQFVKNDETFKFDGLSDTLSLRVEHAGTLSDVVKPQFSAMTMQIARPLAPAEYTFKAKFDCRHSGYGDRTGKYLAQVITPHEAEITVAGCQVMRAVMDGKWDMLSEKVLL
jgi:hypothetical protein